MLGLLALDTAGALDLALALALADGLQGKQGLECTVSGEEMRRHVHLRRQAAKKDVSPSNAGELKSANPKSTLT